MPWRQGHGQFAAGPAIQLCGPTRAGTGATAKAPVLDLQQSGMGKAVKVECGELATHGQRPGRLVTSDCLRAGGHEVIQTFAVRFLQEGDGLHGIEKGRCGCHGAISSNVHYG